MATEFSISPEKQASIPRFFYHQITYKPVEVSGVSLEGKIAIVTGSNTGVGFETSCQLLDLGLTKLILAVRNEDNGKAAAAKLLARTNSTKVAPVVEVWNLDLSVYDSIVAFTEKTKSLERLDFVVLNAGIGPAKHQLNQCTGHEECIQVNYLSTALLAVLLLPVVKSKRSNQPQPSRITFVLSECAAWTSFKQKKEASILTALDNPQPGKADMLDQMFISKLLGQFFIAHLAKVVPPSVALINSTSPATVHDSEFNREHDKTTSGAIAKRATKLYGNKASIAARMVTDAVVNHGEETHGKFLSFQKIVPMAPIIYTPEGEAIRERLWEETVSELSFAKVEDVLGGLGK
ncbi:Short chain dehydrogenase yanD [Lachnellula suecica]|uniref:Short chain dehydrogenase yanD n=1 Tax=Lachnellula suecica TaxID=602035 RepID=A0A8T9CCN3_9HELO|nr:Short chain dehydrogenase yanD [Lachnellula suecica]